MSLEFLSTDNLEEALDFAEKSHADSAWKEHVFSREILRRNLVKMIGNDNYFTCMYRKDGRIIGYFFARIGGFIFSETKLGIENGIYILPAHRGGRVAYVMMQKFLEWCNKMRVEPLVDIYFSNDLDNEKTYGFFRKLGMIECGRSFRGGSHGLRTND